MTDAFIQKFDIEKFIKDGDKFEIYRKSDYISYPEFTTYFSKIETITKHDLIIGINFTYGWMPTIFDFRSDNFDDAIVILNSAKQGSIPTENELKLLKELLNNSLVGTSKLLHFINPSKFAIWDSRVYRYITGNEPYEKRIGNCAAYLDYLMLCDNLTKLDEFENIKEKIEMKVGYSMTPSRIVELIMYSNGQKKK